MSITRLRSMLTDDEWQKFTDSIESAVDALSIIRDLSGSEADEVRDLWNALHIAEQVMEDISEFE